jgi:L-ascorbate metabolism protein UlaG (beta-lactamase superfamily)
MKANKYFLMLTILIFSLKTYAEDVTITYLQNAGVLISDGEQKVLIDALFNNVSGWINLSLSELNKLKNADEPYDSIDVVLITHNHGDHYSTSVINSYLGNNPNTKLIAPPQVTANFSSSQIVNITPSFWSSETVFINDIEIEVFYMRHFDAFGNDFSNVQNYGFLVRMGGYNILHLGDVEMTVENLQSFGFVEKNIDYVLIPTFNTEAHLTQAHKDALLAEINPSNIIGLHLLSSSINTIKQQVNNLYPNAIIFSNPLEKVTLTVTSVENNNTLPIEFELYQNYPNPFNPETTISYSIPSAGTVRLRIFDVIGSEILNLIDKNQTAGLHTYTFNANDLSSGVYFYTLEFDEKKQRAKMLFLK